MQEKFFISFKEKVFFAFSITTYYALKWFTYHIHHSASYLHQTFWNQNQPKLK